jgi:hypothetical protein
MQTCCLWSFLRVDLPGVFSRKVPGDLSHSWVQAEDPLHSLAVVLDRRPHLGWERFGSKSLQEGGRGLQTGEANPSQGLAWVPTHFAFTNETTPVRSQGCRSLNCYRNQGADVAQSTSYETECWSVGLQTHAAFTVHQCTTPMHHVAFNGVAQKSDHLQ